MRVSTPARFDPPVNGGEALVKRGHEFVVAVIPHPERALVAYRIGAAINGMGGWAKTRARAQGGIPRSWNSDEG
jgi:hypothetical protein